MKYYRMSDNLEIANRWFLGEINFRKEEDMWQYVSAGSIENPQRDLKIAISEKGDPVDITMAEFEILIVNKRASDIFPEDQIQKIRIAIKDLEKESHFILVVKNEIDCIDREKSEFEIWGENNKIRPDLAGKFRMIS